MNEITFFVSGTPKGQPRPRAFAFHGKARVYDPGTAEGWKSCIALAAKPYLTADTPVKEPIKIVCTFVLPRPKSHYRTGKNAYELKPGAPLYHVAKPDIDNFLKAVFDALVAIRMLADDCFIADARGVKMYGDKPGAAVSILPV